MKLRNIKKISLVKSFEDHLLHASNVNYGFIQNYFQQKPSTDIITSLFCLVIISSKIIICTLCQQLYIAYNQNHWYIIVCVDIRLRHSRGSYLGYSAEPHFFFIFCIIYLFTLIKHSHMHICKVTKMIIKVLMKYNGVCTKQSY